jgi:hypothetical protein
MVGPIERVRRFFGTRHMAPVMMLVVCVSVPRTPAATTPPQVDPVRRATGYGGVLPIPGPSAAPTAASRADAASIDQQHRDLRAARGRVLYAPGRGPRDSVPVRVHTHKTPCPTPEQRVGEGGRFSVSVRPS